MQTPNAVRRQPPLRDRRARRAAPAGRLQFAAQRPLLSRRISSPPPVSTSGRSAAPRTAIVDELFVPVVAARRAAPPGQFPARLARREPRALRARPEDVRRQPADLRQCPLGARRRRPRHDRPHRLGKRGDLRRAARPSRRRWPASRTSTSPTIARSASWSPAPTATSASPCCSTAIRCRRRCAAATAGSPGHRARRPLRDELRRRTDRRRRPDPDPPRLFGQPQQALCRRLHHRALRPARPAASTPCRSRSTAASTWTSGTLRARRAGFQRLAADLRALCRRSWRALFAGGFLARGARRPE